MHPGAYVLLERLPLTPNGKVDRKALPAPEQQAVAFEAPETATEVALAEVWCEVLGLEQVSVTAGFFDLGGHSLLATRLINAVRRRMEVDLSVRLIFERPDIRSIAALIDAHVVRQANLAMAMDSTKQVELEW